MENERCHFNNFHSGVKRSRFRFADQITQCSYEFQYAHFRSTVTKSDIINQRLCTLVSAYTCQSAFVLKSAFK